MQLKGRVSLWKLLLLGLAFVLVVFLLLPDREHISIHAIAPKSGSEFKLGDFNCEADAPKLFVKSPKTNNDWIEIKELELSAYVNCLARPALMVLSPDESTLFIRYAWGKSRPIGPYPNMPLSSFWSDAVDVAEFPPELLHGGGLCCMEEDYETRRKLSENIDKLSRDKGVVLPPN